MGAKHGRKTAPRGGQKPDPEPFGHSGRRTAMRLLLGAAMVCSLYLLYVSVSGGAVAGCGPDSGCDRVLRSRWAYWLGIPVSAPAFMLYAALFALATWYPRAGAARQRQLWQAMFGLAVLLLGAAAWFVALMLFAVQGLCPFCLAAHGAAVAAALLVLTSAPVQPEPEPAWQKEKRVYLVPPLARRLAAAGVAGVALLAGGQLAFQKSGHVVKAIPPLPSPLAQLSNPPAHLTLTSPAPNTVTAAPGATTAPAPPALAGGRIVTTHNGFFQYAVAELPLLGSPDATNVIVSLFDYTCHHCHIMHAHLRAALSYFSNRLAILSLPMPLDTACNPLLRRTHPSASNACVYARLGLAVWRADRTRFRQFDDFMFARPQPPPVSEASDFAANLVGADRLGRALADPWIEERLRQHISIYHTNSLLLNNSAMPQLIIGSRAVAGSLNSPGELIKLLNEHLGRP